MCERHLNVCRLRRRLASRPTARRLSCPCCFLQRPHFTTASKAIVHCRLRPGRHPLYAVDSCRLSLDARRRLKLFIIIIIFLPQVVKIPEVKN